MFFMYISIHVTNSTFDLLTQVPHVDLHRVDLLREVVLLVVRVALQELLEVSRIIY